MSAVLEFGFDAQAAYYGETKFPVPCPLRGPRRHM